MIPRRGRLTKLKVIISNKSEKAIQNTLFNIASESKIFLPTVQRVRKGKECFASTNISDWCQQFGSGKLMKRAYMRKAQ